MGKVDQGVVVLWVARHLWHGSLGYFGYEGTGRQVRDILHIHDLFELIDQQLHQIDKVNGQIFNVGGGRNGSVSLKDLTLLCEELTGNHIGIKSVPETRAADLRIYITNNQKITDQLGWKPTLSPKEIITDVVHWLRSEEKIIKPILT